MTEFEKKVYAELRRIPKGTVLAYGELARRIGYPRSARAVGNALHKNPFAPVLPCHRVVCADGSIGGYARGVKTKIALLTGEGVQIKNGKAVL